MSRHYDYIYVQSGTHVRGRWSADGAYGEGPLTRNEVEVCLHDAEKLVSDCLKMGMTNGCWFEMWEKRVTAYKKALDNWPA